MATINFDTKTLTITIQLSPTEGMLLAQTGQSQASFQGQFDTYIAGLTAQQMERDKVSVRSKIDTASSDQLQAAKTALGL